MDGGGLIIGLDRTTASTSCCSKTRQPRPHVVCEGAGCFWIVRVQIWPEFFRGPASGSKPRRARGQIRDAEFGAEFFRQQFVCTRFGWRQKEFPAKNPECFPDPQSTRRRRSTPRLCRNTARGRNNSSASHRPGRRGFSV